MQVVRLGERLGGHVGLAEAAQIVADHPVVRGEGVHLVVPHPGVGDPGVDQHQR